VDVETANIKTESAFLGGVSISPFNFAKIGYSFGISLVEFKTFGFLDGGKYKYQSSLLKFRALSESGDVHKISLAFGISAKIKTEKSNNNGAKNMVYSPVAIANILFPEVFHSLVSVNIDKMQCGAGILSYPFFESMKTSLAFSGEIIILLDKKVNYYDDNGTYFQPGVQFKATEKLVTKLSFQRNKNVLFELVVGM